MDPAAPVKLGRTDLVVTRLALGLAPIGGLYVPVGDEQGVATVDRAWERGLRLFDTAPLYGYGLSERRAGMALGKRPRRLGAAAIQFPFGHPAVTSVVIGSHSPGQLDDN